MSQRPQDTAFLRRLRPTTIFWLGLLLGFMGILFMAVATVMVGFAMRSVDQAAQQAHFGAPAPSPPTLITSLGRHDSPDGRFKLTAAADANGIVRYSITTTDQQAARLAQGSFDPAPEPGDSEAARTRWFFCWDSESNLWVSSGAGHTAVHRLRQTISFDRLDGWLDNDTLRAAAPEPVRALLDSGS